jgi:Uma2 family endonuclease
MAPALLEKQKVTEPEIKQSETSDGAAPYHWTVEAFTKASEAGVFGYSERLELIQGRIIKIMGQGPRHATLASEIADMLRDAAKKQFAIREEKPVRIDFDGEPIPDVMVLSGRQADYGDHQPVPEDVRLLVEVSVTTVEYDLGEKALLYAQAGVTDYWAVLVNEAAIVVHREPSPEGYQNVMRLAGTDSLSPLAMPEVVWTVNALLGHEEQ